MVLKRRTINFPIWVRTSKCKTRTFRTVIPKTGRYRATRHGALVIVQTYPNRPTTIVPRIGLPGFYTKWEDTNAGK